MALRLDQDRIEKLPIVLVSEIQSDGVRLVLDEPVFIQAGERYRMDGEDFVVGRLSGEVERCASKWGCR